MNNSRIPIRPGVALIKQATLKVKYFHVSLEKLDFIENKSDWVDLRCADNITLKVGEFKLIPLGVAIKLPDGYEAHIAPRSSTFKNYGIIQTNSVGVIDNSYCGNNDQWMIPVYATRDTSISFNDRIAQFRIMEKQPRLRFNEVSKLEDTDRGGFGSTGIK